MLTRCPTPNASWRSQHPSCPQRSQRGGLLLSFLPSIGSLPVFPHQTRVSFLLLLAALAWHVGIATKSLARDLGIGKRTRDIMRAAYVLAVFALVVLVLVAS